MVCYAMRPVQDPDSNPIQSIVNILLGLDTSRGGRPHDQVDGGWVDTVFAMPEAGTTAGEQGANTSDSGGVV